MFCFPYAGGSEVIFQQWGNNLPMVEVYSAKLPGRGKRVDETPFNQLAPMVEAIASAIVPLLSKDFIFFGHSMGAVIAFELAQFLRREHGLEPKHLFASGRNAPHLPERRPPTYHLPEDQFLDELRRLNGTPKEVLECRELLQLIMRMLRADFELVQTYRCLTETPLDCPITAFGGMQDEDVWLEDLEGWRQHTRGSFARVMFPGGHFFINTDQQLLFQELSRRIHPLTRASETARL